MKKRLISPRFLKILIPSTLVLTGIIFYSLDHYASKIRESQKKASRHELTAWIARERVLVETREETVVEHEPTARTIDYGRPEGDWDIQEPHDEGIEYDYLRDRGMKVSYQAE